MKTDRIIGCSTPVRFLSRKRFADYRAAGIGAIELKVGGDFEVLHDMRSIANEAAAEDVMTWSIHLPNYYVTPTDENERRAVVQIQTEWIKKAADAGFRRAVIHPSGEPILQNEREALKNACRTSIAELSRIAKEAGTRLAVEVLPRTCLGNCSEELLDLLRDAPDAGVCFDTNHLLKENPIDFLDAVAPRLLTLHMSDYDGVDERHWLPGEGILDWKTLMDRLDAVGYDGVLMYEVLWDPYYTIQRDHPITIQEIGQNAYELVNRLPLTRRGIPLV